MKYSKIKHKKQILCQIVDILRHLSVKHEITDNSLFFMFFYNLLA